MDPNKEKAEKVQGFSSQTKKVWLKPELVVLRAEGTESGDTVAEYEHTPYSGPSGPS